MTWDCLGTWYLTKLGFRCCDECAKCPICSLQDVLLYPKTSGRSDYLLIPSN